MCFCLVKVILLIGIHYVKSGSLDVTGTSKCKENEELKWTGREGKIIKGNNVKVIYSTQSYERCQQGCIEDKEFLCRSVEYNSYSRVCNLSNKRTDSSMVEMDDDEDFILYEWFCVQATTTGVVTTESSSKRGPAGATAERGLFKWREEYWVLLGSAVIIFGMFIISISAICLYTRKPKTKVNQTMIFLTDTSA